MDWPYVNRLRFEELVPNRKFSTVYGHGPERTAGVAVGEERLLRYPRSVMAAGWNVSTVIESAYAN